MTTLADLTQQVPPHAADVERALLGVVLLEGRVAWDVVTSHCERADFYIERHRQVWDACAEAAAAEMELDLVIVSQALRLAHAFDDVGQAYLTQLRDEAGLLASVPHYASILREHARRRALITQAWQMLDAAYEGQRPAAELVAPLRATWEAQAPGVQAGAWPLYDAADSWDDVAELAVLVDGLLPLHGVTWWGGMPKRYKSLLLLYVCLAIACRRDIIAEHFRIRAYPKILYVAKEDGHTRIKARRDDILAAWKVRPEPGAIRFLIRPRLDLLNPIHVEALRAMCVRDGITLLILDTWTALSPAADPLGPKDQAQLAAVVVSLAAAIKGQVIVVDHSRKNRPDGAILSSADIFGPPQKWAAAEHIVMLDTRAGDRTLVEVFIEGKDMEGDRLALQVNPQGRGLEKFTLAASITDLAEAQRAVGDTNREAVRLAVVTLAAPTTRTQIEDHLKTKAKVELSPETVKRHLAALVKDRVLVASGKSTATRYSVPVLQKTAKTPSDPQFEPSDGGLDGAGHPSDPRAHPHQDNLYDTDT